MPSLWNLKEVTVLHRWCFDANEDWLECSIPNTATYSTLQSYIGNYTDESTILVRLPWSRL